MKDCCPTTHILKYMILQLTTILTPKISMLSWKRQINYKEKINILNTEARNKLNNSFSTQLLQAVEHKMSYKIYKKKPSLST